MIAQNAREVVTRCQVRAITPKVSRTDGSAQPPQTTAEERDPTVVKGASAITERPHHLGLNTPFDVRPDGKRFLVQMPVSDVMPPINVILNWQELLRK